MLELPLTWTQFLWWHSYPHTGGSIRRARSWQQVAGGELQLHEDHGIGSCNRVLCMANVILQSLTLISTELTLPRAPRALITQWEDVIAERRDGKSGALIR